MKLNILKVTSTDDHAKVHRFIKEVFLPDLPVLRVFGIDTTSTLSQSSPSTLSQSPPSTLSQSPPSPHKTNPESRDFTLKAVDSNGEIIGIAINKEQPIYPPPSPENSEFNEFIKFVENTADIKSKCETSIELHLLSVSKEWRGRGVARQLAEECARVARSLGYDAIKVFCTSEFTAKLARRLGWREIYRLAYADYPALSGRQITLAANPPHDYVYFYINEF